MNEVHEITGLLSYIWKYKLITIAGIKLSFGNVFLALVLLLFATRLSRLITKFVNRRLIEPFVHDRGTQNTYKTLVFYLSSIILITLSLTIAGIPLTVFTVIGGALAIGVGFGSQNIVNNFISGLILIAEKPIRVGDTIDLDDISGVVVSIGTRSTKVRNGDNKTFIVPNSFFLEKRVLNWNYNSTRVRTLINFGVAYNSDVRLVENTCLDIMLNMEGVEQNPMPLVLFDNFADSSLNFQLVFHCDTTKIASLAIVRSNIRFAIDQKFKENKIEMAFPQRDMNLKTDRAIEVKVIS